MKFASGTELATLRRTDYTPYQEAPLLGNRPKVSDLCSKCNPKVYVH